MRITEELYRGDQTETEKGARAYSNQGSDLGGPHSCLQWCLSRDCSQWFCPFAEASSVVLSGMGACSLPDLGL